MIKKWSYVVATVATVFGGAFLTGCIDNDEPFGIEQIRVETANLLKAKQALIAADAAQKLAQAELDKANAEIARINAEIQKAQAESELKIKELEAEIKAAKDKAEAEKAQALADMEKAKLEVYIADQKAKLDYLIADNDLKIKNSQLEYDKLVYNWELCKLNISNNVSSALYKDVELAYSTYITELGNYNTKAENLANLQRQSAQWLNDLVYEDGKWTHPKDKLKKELEKEIAGLQQNISDANDAIDVWEEQITNFENVKTNNDVYKMWADYSEKVKENDSKKAELEVERENIRLANEPLFAEVGNLWTAYQELGVKEIEIPAYTWEPTPVLSVLGMVDDEVIVPEGETYSLYNPNQSSNLTNYYKYVTAYENAISRRKHYLMDENDVLWTNARVNEMTRQKGEAEKVFDAAKAEWENAKAVYNMGNAVEADKLPLESEVEKAVNDYNAFEATIAPIKEQIAQAEENYTEASNNYWDAWNEKYSNGGTLDQTWKEAQETKNKADQDAWDAYWAAESKAYADRNQTIENARKAMNNAWQAYYRAQNEYNAILNELNLNPDDKTLQASAEAAKTAMDNALTAAEKSDEDYTIAMNKANETCNRAVAAAETVRVKALNAAEEAYDKAEAAWVASGKDDAVLTDLREKMDKANDALNELRASLDPIKEQMTEACAAVDEAISNQLKEIGLAYWPNSNVPQSYQVEDYINSVKYNWNYDFPVASAPILYMDTDEVYTNAKYYLIEKSRVAYGSLGRPWNNGEYNGESHDGWISGLEIDKAFLVNEVTIDMMNAYVKNYCKKNYNYVPQDYECYNFYVSLFGACGQVEYLANRISVAEAIIANSSLSETAIGDLEKNLEALEASKVAAEEKLATAKEAYDVKAEAVQELYAEVDSNKAELILQNLYMNRVLQAINRNFSLLNDMDRVNPEDVQGAIDYLNGEINIKKGEIENTEKALKEAQDNLTLLENGNAEYDVNPYTNQIELLTAQLEVSKDRLDLIKSRLEELQAKYEAAAKQ